MKKTNIYIFFYFLFYFLLVSAIYWYCQIEPPKAFYLVAFLSFLAMLIGFVWVNKNFIHPINKLTQLIENKSLTKEFSKVSPYKSTVTILNHILNLEKNIQKTSKLAEDIGNGEFETENLADDSNNELDVLLSKMKFKLKNKSIEDNKTKWAIEGLTLFDQIFRENLTNDVKSLSKQLVTNLVKYSKSNQSGIYIINDTTENPFIELIASVAYSKNILEKQNIDITEGLLGQCIIDKKTIYISELPDDYLSIESGLGKATPSSLLIVPAIYNDNVIAMIEIAKFGAFDSHVIAFLEKLASNFASTYQLVKSNAKMSNLLNESKNITTELQLKEQTLLTNESELKEMQETLNVNLIELMAESNLTKSILEAINKSNACIHFDVNGNILEVNDMFLSVMRYEKHELIGNNENILIPEAEIDSPRHQMMWKSLRAGNFNSGELIRLDKTGKEIWMDVTFNPIFTLDGKVFKILMFANFTTDQKEKEKEYRTKMDAINESMAFLQLKLDFSFVSVNPYFINNMNIKRKDVKNLNFITLIDNPLNNPDLIAKVKCFQDSSDQFNECLVFKTADNEIYFNTTITKNYNLKQELTSFYVILGKSKINNFESNNA